MEDFLSLEAVTPPREESLAAMDHCNELTQRYGLSLTSSQIQALFSRRAQALRETGRVEFGEGVLPKLIEAFCDSPYLNAESYARTLSALQDLFYHFKNESLERLSDGELIGAMKAVFDGRGEGSLEYLAGTALETLCRAARDCEIEKGTEDWSDWFERDGE